MTTDIQVIRNSLKNCEEVTLPYKFSSNCWIKYINIKGDDEAFYEGGEYVGMGNHKIILNIKGRHTYVPTCMRTDDGETIYKARFFIDQTKPPTCENDIKELLKTIKSQQHVIKLSAEQIKILEGLSKNYKNDNYELRVELEQKNRQLDELISNEKKYKLILSQYR